MHCSIEAEKKAFELMKFDNISVKLHIRDLIHIFEGYLDEILGCQLFIWEI